MNDYKEAMENISPDLKLIEKTKEKMKKTANKNRVKRPALAAACLILILIMTVTAFAVPESLELIKDFSTGVELMLRPVDGVCVYDGIEMAVTYAGTKEVDGGNDVAVVYITMKDLSGKGRINETADLYNYGIKGFNSSTCSLESFDGTTGTATFKFSVSQFTGSGSKSWKKKGGVFVQSFLLNEKRWNEDAGFDLVKALEKSGEAETEKAYLYSYSGEAREGSFFEKQHYDFLKKDVLDIKSETAEWLSLSNISYADGRLRIQVKVSGNMAEFNHCELVLLDENGEYVPHSRYYTFDRDDKSNEIIGKYDEYVYEIENIDDLDKYKFEGSFGEVGQYIEGDWKVTFNFNN